MKEAGLVCCTIRTRLGLWYYTGGSQTSPMQLSLSCSNLNDDNDLNSSKLLS